MLLNKRVLFISHNASMSGAPFVLLYLLQWLKKNGNCAFDVLLLHDGPLKKDFAEVAGQVYIPGDILGDYKNGIADRVKRKLQSKFGKLTADDRMLKVSKTMNVQQYDIIYGNTILSFEWVLYFKRTYNSKVLCAIHELKTNMESSHARAFLEENLPKMDMIIAGSGAVLKNLTERYGVPANMIRVVHAFIHQHLRPSANNTVIETTGIKPGQFIIGSIGHPEWRKGTDLFIHIALCLKRNYPDFDFNLLWLGGNENDTIIKNLLADIETCNLTNHFTFVGSTRKYLDYMEKFDVFAMLSREDPFPLVSLEASFLSTPIVMFEGTGGTAELLANGGGFIVPYLDIEELAAQLYTLYKDAPLREQMGSILKNEVVQKYNSDILCKKVASLLEAM